MQRRRPRAGYRRSAERDGCRRGPAARRAAPRRPLHQLPGRRHRIDLAELTGGKAITVYGQNEVVRDLIDARLATSRPLYFEAEHVSSARSIRRVRCSASGMAMPITRCTAISSPAATGFTASAVRRFPQGVLTIYERIYPFGWLGILAEAAPSSDELVYTCHERGFALFSMRSQSITRLYLQVPPDESIEHWSDEAIWAGDAHAHDDADGWRPNVGRIIQKGVTPMRSFVAAPMRHHRLFLAGDAAHIVPPTGAKGLNLAASDVLVLARALKAFYERGRTRVARRILGRVPAPRLEGAAILLVDDVDAAPLSGRQRVRPSTADRRSRLPHELACGDDEPRGAVRRAAGGGVVRIRGALTDPGCLTSGRDDLLCPGVERHESDEIVREPRRLLPMERVTGALVGEEPCSRNDLEQSFLCGAAHVGVALAPHQQRGRHDTFLSSLVKSGVFRNPSNASRHTRAGTFSVSETTVSRWSGAMSRASVLSCHSRAKAGVIGSASGRTLMPPVRELLILVIVKTTLSARCPRLAPGDRRRTAAPRSRPSSGRR